MGPQAVGTVLDTFFGIGEIAAAVFAQGIQRAVAEHAAENFRVRAGMAGKIFTFPVLKKVVMAHINQPFGRDASAQIEMKVCRQTAAFLVELC